MPKRRLLKIIRPPAADPVMTIDGVRCQIVRIKVRDGLIEVLFEEDDDDD